MAFLLKKVVLGLVPLSGLALVSCASQSGLPKIQPHVKQLRPISSVVQSKISMPLDKSNPVSINSSNVSAASALGDAYYNGSGVPQDYSTAAIWYSLAASRGDIVSQYHLAVMYSAGLGVQKNNSKAFYWFLKSPNLNGSAAIGCVRFSV
ncbi:tetratricopeptide repeat protein [Acidiphilium sp. C61]|uniref:tetratricopeptide repeat protein n=1 Tax=Acidiphilium sp. C61 TaxID=1671485 RepID=UPI00157BAC62|nr:tetratricopeptide repeat protein [Acidiphilium sp. C61]HQT65939.1 tetratricopeptide repeat protein [Acidocella sp.]